MDLFHWKLPSVLSVQEGATGLHAPHCPESRAHEPPQPCVARPDLTKLPNDLTDRPPFTDILDTSKRF